MNGIMDSLEEATKKLRGKRYQSHKFCYDSLKNSVVEYEQDKEVEWQKYSESEHITRPKDLTNKIKFLRDLRQESWFKYFLDGSRHTYKVDDMDFGKNVYPILAGQVGISCCTRVNKRIHPLKNFFNRKLVIVVPTCALPSEYNKEADCAVLLGKINQSKRLIDKKMKIDDVLMYNLDDDEKFDKKGIAKIQDYMIQKEKEAVKELVKKGLIGDESYLIKDGSLEYKATRSREFNLSDAKMKNAYQYVIGVSKSFNPAMCYTKGGGTNSSIIAGLKVNERTPAYCYDSPKSGNDVSFCVWYLRLRDSKYTQNVFDGVIKVEKLIQDDEKQHGVDSELIDTISAFLLMERNPVAYGKDARWANHLYPVYVTETFAKSRYISNDTFLRLF